jgi:hypothetical protein
MASPVAPLSPIDKEEPLVVAVAVSTFAVVKVDLLLLLVDP